MSTRFSHAVESTTTHKRGRRLVAATLAAGLTVSGITLASAHSAGAADPISQSTARFLSGSIGGQNLDTLAAIQGEGAVNPGNAGPNANSLNVSLLNNAIQLPFKNGLQLPGLGAIQLGAVNQYAAANGNGSALGASGAVDSNGGIGVGGSNGVPTGGASIDLSGLSGASAITDALANLKLNLGAVTARAQQAPFHAALTDPSASCVNGPYSRVSDANQAGSYNIAGLGVDLVINGLSQQVTAIANTLQTTLNTLATTVNGLGLGLLTVSLPNLGDILTGDLVNLANGSITLSLTGGLHIDLAGLLDFLGLSLNQLCPNTSLLPYVLNALTQVLPGALATLLTELLGDVATIINGIDVKLGNTSLLGNGLVAGVVNTLSTTLSGIINQAGNALKNINLAPLTGLLGNLLDIRVNGQGEAGGTFTETALELKILPQAPVVGDVAPAAAVAAGVDLALGKASVGPSNEPATPTTPPGSEVPTGVPAGQASTGSPVAPLALLVVGLFMAGGGALAWRLRGRRAL